MCDNCENPQICKYGKCQRCYFTKRRWCIDNNKCFFRECKLRQFKTKKDWNNRISHKSCWKNNF